MHALLLAVALTLPSVEHYKLVLRVDPAKHALDADAEIRVRNTTGEPMTSVPVLLYRLMEVTSSPLKFTQQVVKFPDEPSWQVNAVSFALPQPLAAGESTTIAFKYAGQLFGYPEVMQYVKDTIGENYTLFRNESLAYPLVATPSEEAWRHTYRNKFDYEIQTVVPEGYLTLCSGGCSGHDASSMNIAIAKFRAFENADHTLHVYAMPEDAESGTRVIGDMTNALGFFRSYFGPMPNTSNISLIEIPSGWGSYAMPGTIFQAAAAFKDPEDAPELYHEVGHIWNAKTVEAIQRTRYFDEGFAMYEQALAVRHFQGEVAYKKLMDDLHATFLNRLKRDPRGATVPIIDYGKFEIGGFSYTKGAWSLYALHQMLGEDLFRKAITNFLTEYAEKPTDFESFRASLEKTTGRDLGAWYRKWITGTEEW